MHAAGLSKHSLSFFLSNKIASGRPEVSLCLSGKRRGNMCLGRVLFVECSGICRFCKARRTALPMSMEARPAPRGPLLTPQSYPLMRETHGTCSQCFKGTQLDCEVGCGFASFLWVPNRTYKLVGAPERGASLAAPAATLPKVLKVLLGEIGVSSNHKSCKQNTHYSNFQRLSSHDLLSLAASTPIHHLMPQPEHVGCGQPAL
eukprot:1157891-Pelagomonas_calceolata.AAC.16